MEFLNPTEIAGKRSLSTTTIYSQKPQLYLEGEQIELEKHVIKEIADKVGIACNNWNRMIALKPIYKKLNEQVSYGEIRLCVALFLKNK